MGCKIELDFVTPVALAADIAGAGGTVHLCLSLNCPNQRIAPP